MFVKASELKIGDVILDQESARALVVEDIGRRGEGYPSDFLTVYTYVRNDPPSRGRRYFGPNYVIQVLYTH